MAEQRKKTGSVCVKNAQTGVSAAIELFLASEWGGAAGLYRLRVDRAWLNGTRGAMRFYDLPGVWAVAGAYLTGQEPPAEAPEAPDMPKGAPVSVPNGRCGRDATRIGSERPFRGYDGRWYVACYIIGRGDVMIPCDDVIMITARRSWQMRGEPSPTAPSHLAQSSLRSRPPTAYRRR